MPGPNVSMGGMAMCIFGAAPSPLLPLPTSMTMMPTPAANIMNLLPFVGVPGFGMCTSPANPKVIAKLGAPSPCTPVITPWIPMTTNVMLGMMPTVTATGMTMCTIGAGVVKVTMPGEFNVMAL